MNNFERFNYSPDEPEEQPDNTDREHIKSIGQNVLSVANAERVVDRNLENAEVSTGAIDVINTLGQAGFEAYLVGGFVRDALLGKIPKDEDITTNATPDQTTQIFEQNQQKVIPSGIEFGTVTVLDGDNNEVGYEITTYRTDGESSDGRHPDEVVYATTITEDLGRRDFTMNAIAFNPLAEGEARIIDPYNGIADLESGVIRSVGDPSKRISEDKLRMMRAVRFAAQKDMTIDPNLSEAIKQHSSEVKDISGERIGAEVTKLILSNRPDQGLSTMQELGLMQAVLPEVADLYQTEQNNPWHIYNAGEHTEKVVAACPNNFHVRMAALLHDIGKAKTKTTTEDEIDHFIGHDSESATMANTVLRRLRFKKEDTERICKLISLHDRDILPTEEGVCRFIERHQDVTPDEFEELILLKLADNAGQNPAKTPERIESINQAANIYREIVASRPYRISDLALNGRDVMNINQTRRGDVIQLQGKAVGMALQRMLSFALRNPESNNPDDLKDFLQGNLKSIQHDSMERSKPGKRP